MFFIKRIFVLIFLATFLILGGCASSSEIETGEVTLLVTRDFGNESIYMQQLELTSQRSVMGLLSQHLDVKTSYGGGFVNSINGLESGYTHTQNSEQLDWFYYINGIMTNVGATEYFPNAGDVVWWDYHPWGNIPFTPAVIGAFPQPFLNGYKGNNPGTVILAGESCADSANFLQSYFIEIGVSDIKVKDYDEGLAVNRSKNTIVVALWSEIEDSIFWRGIQDNRDKTGWFAELGSDVFHTLNAQAERQESFYENVGVVLATGTGMGDDTPLWLITGLDQTGIDSAIKMLVDEKDSIKGGFGFLIHEQDVKLLPVQ